MTPPPEAAPGAGRIIHADVLKGLAYIPDESIDLIVTSPPYADARRKQYGGHPPAEYVDWYLPIARELRRVCRPAGSYVLVIKERVTDGQRDLYVRDLLAAHVRRAGWRWHEEAIWYKTNGLPLGRPYLRDRWEHCFWFARSADPYIVRDANRLPLAASTLGRRTGRRSSAVRPCTFPAPGIYAARTRDQAPHNVLSIGTGTRTGTRHPAVFPPALPAWFIRLLSPPAGLVLDPFMGSGTTAIAAEREGRHWIGIERSAEYVRTARRRIAAERPGTR